MQEVTNLKKKSLVFRELLFEKWFSLVRYLLCECIAQGETTLENLKVFLRGFRK